MSEARAGILAGTSRARVYLGLGRVSNLPTVWTNVLAGIVLAGATPRAATVVALAAALSLFYMGGMFLNDAFDREVDARERPERPIPSGLVGAGEVFAVGFGLLAAGWLAVLAVSGPSGGAPVGALALAAAIVVYDAWHKGNPLGPLLMGVCRALVYVTAGLAVAPRPETRLAWAIGVLLAYLIGLTYVAKHETGSPLRRLWPLAVLAMPFVYALPVLRSGPAGAAFYLALAGAVVFALWLLQSDRPRRVPRAVVTLIAGISLLDAVLLAGAGAPGMALVAALGFPLTLALQRYVVGT